MEKTAFILSQENSIANNFLAEMRSLEVQRDRMRFRKNCERIGEILAYEISKSLEYKTTVIQTPLAQKVCQLIEDQPVLISILRAGIALHGGFSNFYDRADQGFIGAYRAPEIPGEEVKIQLDYVGVPSLENRHIILVDPMLATGSSLVSAYQSLLNYGKPQRIDIAAVIAAQAGVDRIKEAIPEARLWIGDLDPELNEKYYIVPGLGDAGDLSFGPKV